MRLKEPSPKDGRLLSPAITSVKGFLRGFGPRFIKTRAYGNGTVTVICLALIDFYRGWDY
jgi:hypothetical protein